MSNTTTSRQFWIQSIGHGEIVHAELPMRRTNEVLVRTLYSGISRGTESLVFSGQVPPSQFQSMRAPFQEGEFPAPIKYGYINVGVVEAGPESLVGEVVFCLYPHQDLYCVPESAVTSVPKDVPAERAVLAAYMQTAINAVWDGHPSVGDQVVVVGAGAVGLLVAWLCRQIPGVEVTVVDTNDSRQSIARNLELRFVTDLPSGTQADVVVHASGQPAGLVTALSVAGVESTIVDVSWYGSNTVDLPLGEAFHSKRLTIRSSQVSLIPPLQNPRWDFDRRSLLALTLLRDPALECLITGESQFEDLPNVLGALSVSSSDTLCHRITYPSP